MWNIVTSKWLYIEVYSRIWKPIVAPEIIFDTGSVCETCAMAGGPFIYVFLQILKEHAD